MRFAFQAGTLPVSKNESRGELNLAASARGGEYSATKQSDESIAYTLVLVGGGDKRYLSRTTDRTPSWR